MKARLAIVFGITLLLSLALGACGFSIVQGSGNIRSEERSVSDFTAVEFSGMGEMTVIQGETEGLTIETDDNLLPYITTAVRGGVLIIGQESTPAMRILRPTHSIRFTLNVRTLERIGVSGAGNINAEALAGDSLTIAQSGAGNIRIQKVTVNELIFAMSGAGSIAVDDLAAQELSVSMSGAGNVRLSGAATRQSVAMSGLGNYEAGNLASDRASIDLSGAGSATVWVRERLEADLSGAGSISYYGSPQADTSTSGIGRVRGLGNK